MSHSAAAAGDARAAGTRRIAVILTGTDPATALGGIGVVMSGYQAALASIPVDVTMLPTYRPGSLAGKWRPWLGSLWRLPRLIAKRRRAGAQPVVYSHCGNLVSMLRESVVLLVARVCGARTLLQVHAPEMDRYLHSTPLRWLVRALFAPAERVCALTPWWARQMQDAGVAKSVAVIANPLPPGLLAAAREPLAARPAAATITVLAMARLVPGKGVDIVIRAMAGIAADFRLVVAGDGSEKAALQRLADELGVAGQIRFAGWVAGAEKERLLQAADIFCLPTTYDVFPMSVVEAMVNGKPVVAARWGGIPDLVDDNRTGLLCAPGEPDAVRGALQRLADPGLRRTMGAAAKDRILELSAPESVGASLAGLLRRGTDS